MEKWTQDRDEVVFCNGALIHVGQKRPRNLKQTISCDLKMMFPLAASPDTWLQTPGWCHGFRARAGWSGATILKLDKIACFVFILGWQHVKSCIGSVSDIYFTCCWYR